MKNRFVAGFTLVEMAVVLVIIGLIVGGLMFGRSMLTTSRLQTVITDEDSYVTAVGNFKQTYQALPGDMDNASSFWTGATNGNANGKIGQCLNYTCADYSGTTGYEFESFSFWQQLQMAGMFNQKLTGTASSGGVWASTLGTNTPTSSVLGGGFSAVWEGTIGSSDANFFAGSYGNVFIFGNTTLNSSSNFLTSGPILTADQAASIDMKIDDGIPSSGRVRALIPAANWAKNCSVANPSAPPAYIYNVSNTGITCSLIFTTGY